MTTIMGIVFGFFVGVSFPSASLAKVIFYQFLKSVVNAVLIDGRTSFLYLPSFNADQIILKADVYF